MKTMLAVIVWGAMSQGCGGSATQPTVASVDATPAATSSGAASHEPDEETSAATKAAVAEATAPAATSGAPIPLEVLLTKGSAGDFPKRTATDKECVGQVNIAGKFDKDYDALSAQCGVGTGMKEYVRKVTGKLDAGHKHDTYSFKMQGGFCYRFFAVGDSSITNLDIFVKQPNGALISVDQNKQPIAILDPSAPWCKHHDREFYVDIALNGAGGGQYAFGIWARPDSK